MQKFINGLKLSLIIVLCIMLLALVEIAPEKPALFFSLSAAYLIAVRFLWKSATREKKEANQVIAVIKNKSGKKSDKNGQAA